MLAKAEENYAEAALSTIKQPYLGELLLFIPFLCEAAPNYLGLLPSSFFVSFAPFAVRSLYSLAHLHTELVLF
jgi:hypothetical protein